MVCDGNFSHETAMGILKEKRSSILELIMNERWHNILEFLSPPSARKQSRRSICAHYDYSRADQENLMNVGNSGNTILHITCMFHPPVHVIEMILIKIPFAVSQANHDGQYPLHVASQYGACPDVIGLLMDHYTPALRRRDNEGKTPLHLSCQSYANNYHVPRDIGLRDPFIPVSIHEDDVQFTIQMITRACTSVVNLEDNQGYNALEYALASDYIHLDTIKCIQRAASRSWRISLKSAQGQVT